MNDITTTSSIFSFTQLNLSNRFVQNQSIINNLFLRYDGNHRSKFYIIEPMIGYEKIKAVNLYYIPDSVSISLYDYLKLDLTSIDITISSITESLITDISTQLDNTDIRVRAMWINKYEFILIFYIDCDYISDISITLDLLSSDYQFIRDYLVKKIKLSNYSYAFKLYHQFR